LTISGNLYHGSKSEFCDAIGKNKSLRELCFKNGEMDYGPAMELAPGIRLNGSLKILRINNLGLSASKASVIWNEWIKNKSLIELDLSNNNISFENGNYMDAIKEIPTLTKLKISDNGIYEDGCKTICEAMAKNTTIKHFCFHGMRGFEPSFCKYLNAMLKANMNITELCLNGLIFNNDGALLLADGLMNRANLTKFKFGNDQPSQSRVYLAKPHHEATLAILNSIKDSIPNLTSFDLSKCFLGDDGVELLLKYLNGKGKLQKLALPENDLSGAGLKIIANIISNQPNIRKIDLSKNNCNSCENLKALALAISQSKSITYLNLSYTKPVEDGIITIMDLISENKCPLRKIYLDGCGLHGSAKINAILNAIQKNQNFGYPSE